MTQFLINQEISDCTALLVIQYWSEGVLRDCLSSLKSCKWWLIERFRNSRGGKSLCSTAELRGKCGKSETVWGGGKELEGLASLFFGKG